jgi:hypothetical protein
VRGDDTRAATTVQLPKPQNHPAPVQAPDIVQLLRIPVDSANAGHAATMCRETSALDAASSVFFARTSEIHLRCRRRARVGSASRQTRRACQRRIARLMTQLGMMQSDVNGVLVRLASIMVASSTAFKTPSPLERRKHGLGRLTVFASSVEVAPGRYLRILVPRAASLDFYISRIDGWTDFEASEKHLKVSSIASPISMMAWRCPMFSQVHAELG